MFVRFHEEHTLQSIFPPKYSVRLSLSISNKDSIDDPTYLDLHAMTTKNLEVAAILKSSIGKAPVFRLLKLPAQHHADQSSRLSNA